MNLEREMSWRKTIGEDQDIFSHLGFVKDFLGILLLYKLLYGKIIIVKLKLSLMKWWMKQKKKWI